MMSPIVSIIVPCYKQAHFLKESLQSVLDQTYSHWECIIVNDGSPDDTESITQKWCALDSRFKYLKKENGGLSSARNAGIAVSRGAYILPLDADDVLHPDYLEKLVPILCNDESLGIVSCYTKFFSIDITKTSFDLTPQGTHWGYLLYVNQLIATSLYRKECWNRVGGYDESMNKGFEDWDFWLNISKRDWNYKIIPEFLFYYRKSKQSMLTETIQKHAEEVKRYIFIKHKELYIKDFDNCMEVLFFELSVQKMGHDRFKNSFEYKIGKIITKPFRIILKLLGIQK
ncbi:glycosyltransferase family A protein [Flavobacterium sp. 83]|uniref:glycosyltransferase family 2 protein n=1 Tax=Flavobacterium sp. 83 TaxID=1131812 RepID=UPI000689D54A|nr:glycosyltransferase family A protein [Flavobacterium sp. 83]